MVESLDGLIVECVWERREKGRGGHWKVMKVRTDKTHPNHISTATNVFKSVSVTTDTWVMLFIERDILILILIVH